MKLADYFNQYNLSTENIEEFEEFKKFLLEYNEHTNLTRITDDDDFNVKHFLDSLSIFRTKLIDHEKKIIDIGTGAGFPGIPLKLYDKTLDITLLDSLKKRIDFLNLVIEKFNLKNIEAIHARAEEIARDPIYREQYDIAISRAVANLSTLSEYALGFVKVGGYFISQKGPEYKEELKEAENAIKTMGAVVEEVIEVPLPNDIEHYLVVLKKIKSTNKKYPRGGGKPRKKPL